jgi:hypothetical protein
MGKRLPAVIKVKILERVAEFVLDLKAVKHPSIANCQFEALKVLAKSFLMWLILTNWQNLKMALLLHLLNLNKKVLLAEVIAVKILGNGELKK